MRRHKLKAVLGSALKLVFLASVFVTGCASVEKVSIEEQLNSKTLQWADALMAQEYDQALTFMTPSYQNSPRSKRFRGEFAGASYWQGAEVKWAKCDEEANAPVGSDDRDAAVVGGAASNADAPEGADACLVNAWEDCGETLVTPVSSSSTISTRSDRCVVRLILTVMKPPEISFAMPIPYEVTWLNLDGDWYIYHQ